MLLSDGPVGRGSHGRGQFEFVAVGLSDVGPVRDHNEDFAFVGQNLIAIADGVGGSVHGEVASALVAGAIRYLEDRIYISSPADDAREAVVYANGRLAEAVRADSALAGMATTLTALRLDGRSVVVLHVGDSRAYRYRDGRLERLTRDDSFVQELLDDGLITQDEARRHPARSVVMQALNGGPVTPHVTDVDVETGDRFLVCSDGLSDYLDPAEIAAILFDAAEPSVACRALLAAALVAGTRDNVSCVVADLVESTPT